MLIGDKLPPLNVNKTYFNLGRSAFAFLVGEIIKPQRVYLPSFSCWSLTSTMQKRFPYVELEFYNVDKNLFCYYPTSVGEGELLVFIHYFGHENKTPLPIKNGGYILEDISHAIASKINYRGDYVFGSLRKLFKISDGGVILNKFFNPIYEKSNNLDSWLRHKASDWRDMREAENMIDREWFLGDISSQSLEVFLTTNMDIIKNQRLKNEKYLYENLSVGEPLINFTSDEAPLVHNRIMETRDKRDFLRSKLSESGIFTSIYWPTHEAVRKQKKRYSDTIWLEDHIVSIPVSQNFNLNDMEYITNKANSIL